MAISEIGFAEWAAILALIVLSALWIATLYDVLMHEPVPHQRLFWATVILLTWVPGALLYTLVRGRSRKRRSAEQGNGRNLAAKRT